MLEAGLLLTGSHIEHAGRFGLRSGIHRGGRDRRIGNCADQRALGGKADRQRKEYYKDREKTKQNGFHGKNILWLCFKTSVLTRRDQLILNEHGDLVTEASLGVNEEANGGLRSVGIGEF